MAVILTAYHGTVPGEPLVGGQDPVSPRTLSCLWASNSYFLAAQFQDGEVRKLEITLRHPLVIDCGGASAWHAHLARQAQQDALSGRARHDGVIFLDTIDGMECGDVVAVFGRQGPRGWSVAHAVREIGVRRYDDARGAWMSEGGFTEDVDAIPQTTTWTKATRLRSPIARAA